MRNEERFKIYIAAYLILIQNREVLLLKRKNTGYQDGNYSLVAGHLDGGETAKQCIIREAEEEAGIILNHDDLEVVHVMHRTNPEREYVDIFLRSTVWTGEITNREPEKCGELNWFSLSNMPVNVIPEVKSAIEYSSKNIFYSEAGW